MFKIVYNQYTIVYRNYIYASVVPLSCQLSCYTTSIHHHTIYAPVIYNHFPHPPTGKGGDSLANLTPGRFSVVKGRAKSKVLTSSLPPGDGAYSRALKTEKS